MIHHVALLEDEPSQRVMESNSIIDGKDGDFNNSEEATLRNQTDLHS